MGGLSKDPCGVRRHHGGAGRPGHGDSHGEGLDGAEDDAEEDQGFSTFPVLVLACGCLCFSSETFAIEPACH